MPGWRLGGLSALVAGVAGAGMLSILLFEGNQRVAHATQQGSGGGELVIGSLLFLACGVIAAGVVMIRHLHPLIPAIPAIWLAFVSAPLIVGQVSIPSWYPSWLSSFQLQAISPGVLVALGVLVVGTVHSLWNLPASQS